MRVCCLCKVEKPLEEFCKDKHDKSGYTYSCKKCRAEKRKEWAKKNPEKVKELSDKHKENRKIYYSKPETKLHYRKKFIERKFKISYEEYEKMQITQDNKCAICNLKETHTDKNYLSVDHDHIIGNVRGLLCSRCNFGLGYFKDNVENLKNAITYLNKNNYENITNPS